MIKEATDINKSNWRQLQKQHKQVQLLMDNYELSNEGYALFKAKGKNANWVGYMEDQSKVHLTDFAHYIHRLQQNNTIRIRLDSSNAQAILSVIPFPEQIKRLSLAHNNLSGQLDLSRFNHLETLTLSGNPTLAVINLIFPSTLNQLIVSSQEQRRLEKTNFKQKFPHVSISQNGRNGFNLDNRPFQEPEMVTIKGGKFWMGSKETEEVATDAEKPQHAVQLTDYCIGKYQVTVAEFARFVAETGYVTTAEQQGWSLAGDWKGDKPDVFCSVDCSWRHDAYGKPIDNAFARYPVIHITWHDAIAYCEWLSKKMGELYQLPTEAQWEYAAIGGHKAAQDREGFHQRKHSYAGSNHLKEVGWYFDKFEGEPHLNYSNRPVGQLKPNELGIYDMCGNVREWCVDFHDLQFYQKSKDAGLVQNPVNLDSGNQRVLRGGGWGLDASANRLASRRRSLPRDRGDAAGFRLILLHG